MQMGKVGEIVFGLSLQFSKMSIWIDSWTEVQCNHFSLRDCSFCGAVVNFRCVPVDRLPELMHHFGLDSFFNDGEHCVLQASLPHSISGDWCLHSHLLSILLLLSVYGGAALPAPTPVALALVGLASQA